ncbi:MAG: DUF1570 domain-containing protein [Planctomycetota bacterium]
MDPSSPLSALLPHISTIARKTTFALFFLSTISFQPDEVFSASPGLVEFQLDGTTRRGLPIMDFSDELIVLGRDGQLHTLTGKEKRNVRSLKESYQPATSIEMRGRLQEEFGRNYEVVATQHFLVVQPRGRGQQWAELFESSHRDFVSYMSRRGVKIRKGRFPMVAVVMPDEAAMYRELAKMQIPARRVAGIYARESNRVITHDAGYQPFTAATLRHEAAHQSAYNYNVHSRVVITPRWVTEGIGQMFEPAQMVQSGLTYRERVNAHSLAVIRKEYDGGQSPAFATAIRDLVGSNEMFNQSTSTENAYSVAWAMMFYLAEREPDRFRKVLSGTASRGTYQPYDRFARLKDFEQWVGCDIDQFSKKVSWFVKSL